MPVAIPLPEAIAFDEAALRLWLEKARGVRRLVHFVLMLRYAHDLGDGDRARVEPMLMDVLGDVPEARGFFGGRTE